MRRDVVKKLCCVSQLKTLSHTHNSCESYSGEEEEFRYNMFSSDAVVTFIE